MRQYTELETGKMDCFFNKHDMKYFAQVAAQKTYEKGDTVFSEGDSSNHFYIITKGQIKGVKYTVSGKELIMEIFTEGEMLEQVAIVDNMAYPYTAVALNRVNVLQLKREFFLDLMNKDPLVACRIMDSVSRRLILAYDRLQDNVGEKVEQRLAKVLLSLYKKMGKELFFTRQDIAGMVGTTIETVIRLTTRLKEKGIIGTGWSKITINNEEKLRLISEYPGAGL